MTTPSRELRELAKLAGLQTAYTGQQGDRIVAGAQSLMAILRSLGHDIRRPEDARAALAAEKARCKSRICEPVIVARAPSHTIRIGDQVSAIIESGDNEIPLHRGDNGDHRLPQDLPFGAYTLRAQRRAQTQHATLLHCPRRCPSPQSKLLGALLPLYALPPSPESHGIATYTELTAVARWAAGAGANLLGTLPLLTTFLDRPFDPSPYAPVSRRRWSELFIDPRATPEATRDPALLANRSGGALAPTRANPADQRLADYSKAWHVLWPILQKLASAAFADKARRTVINRAAASDPELITYAAFRAWCNDQSAGWTDWREPMPKGLTDNWQAHPDVRTFVYAQLEADRQLRAAEQSASAAGAGLYLDLPVGSAPAGFDTFSEPQQHLEGATVGAPPDAFFAHGQSWGFQPPHPTATREAGHDRFRRMARAHLERCTALRIDHAMMLHRLFCIPAGGEPADGVYIRYPADELYAGLAIEAHRAGALIVGENLGTVPREVNTAMRSWGLLGMSVAQFELAPEDGPVLPDPRPNQLACLNTHDTAPFAGYWSDADLRLDTELGVLTPDHAEREAAERDRIRAAVRELLSLPADADPARDASEVLRAIHEHLAAGNAGALLVNLEDLWQETSPQNVPGVPQDRYPSWRRRIAHPNFMNDPSVSAELAKLASARNTVIPATQNATT